MKKEDEKTNDFLDVKEASILVVRERFENYSMRMRSKIKPLSTTGEINRIEQKIQDIKEVIEIVTGFSLDPEIKNDGVKVDE